MATQSDTVTELEARLAEVEAGIEKLCQARIDIHRQLNNLRDPIASRLPLEISSRIFLFCVPPPQVYGTLSAPVLLLRICTSWTEIALFTPVIWANLHLELPDELSPEFVHLLEAWLARGKACPLLLSLEGPPDLHPEIKRLVAAHAQRLIALEIHTHSYLSLFADETVFPALELIYVYDPRQIETQNILDALRASPRLETFGSDAHIVLDEIVSQNDAHGVHQTLRNLNIGASFWTPTSVLPYLTLPALYGLEVMILDVNLLECLISFLTRSPRLRTLTLQVHAAERSWPRHCVEHLLDTIPNLQTLRMTTRTDSQAPDFQDTLIEVLTNSKYLPELTQLTLAASQVPAVHWYTTVTTMLYNRSNTLRSFALQWPAIQEGGTVVLPAEPKEEDKNVFRQLSREGMKIDLGPYFRFLDEE
ncbi:hypothetical protein R3P38DRAFT_3132806 [Favolaschia claudopus]|uniref:F-box domain-containing protein n=1 Tax=Favolaschia claudopus TaxID=2862362 RepID=A0AAV9Z8C8_9AGAR